MIKRIIIVIVSVFLTKISFGQELNCQVSINTQQIQGSVQKQIFDQMKTVVMEFMNNRKWTNDIYIAQERIDCVFLITVSQSLGSDEYLATLQITSERPTYKASYNSPLFNYDDQNFQFKYNQFTQLEFNDNNFQNNLTSVLAYYAYVILALDYDSFSPLGGTPYWTKAQAVVQNAQTASEKGWKSSEGNKNRYWLIENQLQPVFAGIRNCLYKYQREGLDIMWEKASEGRANILKALELLVPVYQNRPASFNMQLFFNAKQTEIVKIFSQGTPEEKGKAVELLMKVDPANTNRYLMIQGN
ncbi:MAG TPA: DUF4835 family protein [Bacteroidia bacterium]|jgi:hypothetical protein|nr:DUF4835 family protein [Bacteroidia bacterium]